MVRLSNEHPFVHPSLSMHDGQPTIYDSCFDLFPLGVSKAILDAAGQAVEAECQDLGKEAFTYRVDTPWYCIHIN